MLICCVPKVTLCFLIGPLRVALVGLFDVVVVVCFVLFSLSGVGNRVVVVVLL